MAGAADATGASFLSVPTSDILKSMSNRGDDETDAWAALARFQALQAPPPPPKPTDPIVEIFQQGHPEEERGGQLCSYYCTSRGWMQPLAANRPNLFGCLQHGSVHECVPRQCCRHTYTHPDGHATCIYSGVNQQSPTIYAGEYGHHEVGDYEHADGEEDYEEHYEGEAVKKKKKKDRARRPPPTIDSAPTRPPRRPVSRHIYGVESVARRAASAIFDNAAGRAAILATLVARARATADAQIATLRKRSVVHYREMVVKDVCRIPATRELAELLAAPFRALAPMGAVYPWPRDPVVYRPPTCPPADYPRIADWLQNSVKFLWSVFEAANCCKNAITAVHALSMYFAISAATGTPVQTFVYDKPFVVLPRSEFAAERGFPMNWIKQIETLSTTQCSVQTCHYNDGKTVLAEMVQAYANKFDETSYNKLCVRMHEIHAEYERKAQNAVVCAPRAAAANLHGAESGRH